MEDLTITVHANQNTYDGWDWGVEVSGLDVYKVPLGRVGYDSETEALDAGHKFVADAVAHVLGKHSRRVFR